MFVSYHKLPIVIGLVLCLFSSVFAYSGGTGEANNPYQIASVSDWQQLMDTSADWNKNFILIADVNLQGVTLTPVGDYNDSGIGFTGVFDGNGHIIRNVVMNYPTSRYIGLFGELGRHGQIHNLGVEDVNITGYLPVGGLVGYNNGSSISNCYSTGAVNGTDAVGGLVGSNVCGGSISDCYSTATVSGRYSIGGLVGSNDYDSSISNCYSTSIVGGFLRVGGLVGYNNGGSISYCYSTGAVNGTALVGGLVGYNLLGSISNCYSTGDVSGRGAIGGLAGNNSGSISQCYSTGAVSGTGAGGLVGVGKRTDVVNSFWDVNTSGWSTSVGGTGKITAEMKTRSTFTSAGWDFVGETTNGAEDIWTMCEGISYPKFTLQNQLPIANAGADQTVYAWIDGVAEAELDGSYSNDPDCNELTYFWSWIIGGNTFEANGVNPTIELPIGVHTIQLTVSDGIADSASDDVNITVIAPLKSKLEIMPCVLNRDTCVRHKHHHKPAKILAIVRLPWGVMKKDIDNNEPLTIYPGEIETLSQRILPYYEGDRRHKKLMTAIWAFFDKDDILDAIPANGNVQLRAVGKLKTGRYFYGADTVRIIAPPKPRPSPKK